MPFKRASRYHGKARDCGLIGEVLHESGHGRRELARLWRARTCSDNRAFSMAITARLAKLATNSIGFSVNGRTR
jgi:hypothetical protein